MVWELQDPRRTRSCPQLHEASPWVPEQNTSWFPLCFDVTGNASQLAYPAHNPKPQLSPKLGALRLMGGIGNIAADALDVYTNHVNGEVVAEALGMVGLAMDVVPGGQAGSKMVTLMGRTMPLDEALKLVDAIKPFADGLTARLHLGIRQSRTYDGIITTTLDLIGTKKEFAVTTSRQDYPNGLLAHFWPLDGGFGDTDKVMRVMLLELGHKLGINLVDPAAAQAFAKQLTVVEK